MINLSFHKYDLKFTEILSVADIDLYQICSEFLYENKTSCTLTTDSESVTDIKKIFIIFVYGPFYMPICYEIEIQKLQNHQCSKNGTFPITLQMWNGADSQKSTTGQTLDRQTRLGQDMDIWLQPNLQGFIVRYGPYHMVQGFCLSLTRSY